MPKIYGHRKCKSLVAVAREDHTHESFNYTEGETKTGCKWIDGKPIYRYVGRLDTLDAGNNLITGFTNAPISDLISVRGVIYGNSIFALPFISVTKLDNSVGVSITNYKTNSPNINVNMGAGEIGQSAPNGTALIIVEYTKATD